MIWIEILLLRPAFQLVEQYVPGTTMLYSLIVLLSFFDSAIRGKIRFDRISLVFLCYLVFSGLVSILSGAAVGVLVAAFNKLLLLFALMQIPRAGCAQTRGEKSLKLLACLTYLQAIFVIASLALPGSYTVTWDVTTFVMSFSSQHLTASYIISLMASIAFEMSQIRSVKPSFAFAVCTALMYALLMTGARTFTLCGVAIYLIAFVKFASTFDRRVRVIVGFSLCLLFVCYFLTNADQFVFFQKSQSVSSNFSNGRDEIWSYYLNVLANSNPIELLFGHGCGFFSTDAAYFVGAHNDFITFAISYGIVGLFLYGAYVCTSISKASDGRIAAVLIITVAFAAFFNGFADYTDFVLAIVLIIESFKSSVRIHINAPQQW